MNNLNNKKALIILSDNIYLTPYMEYYINILKECNFDYDILYWDKNNNEFISKKNYFRFFCKKQGKINKIMAYLKYKKIIMKMMKTDKYSLIIPLHMPIYFFVGIYLIIKWKKKYIFDVRDYSYERFMLFRFLERKLVKHSLINIISSNGYKNFLPKGEYYVHHNFLNKNYDNYKQHKNNNKTIQLSYIGLIRFMEQNKKIISFFKNDDRFHLNFIGTNAEKLEDFCLMNNVKNVSLIGTFDSDKTLEFYSKSDGILNVYGNHDNLLDYALSNKLYYSASMYKPILVSPETYMSKIANEYNLGIELIMKDKKELDDLYNYFMKMNREKYIKNCDKFIDMVVKDQQKTKTELINRIMMERN